MARLREVPTGIWIAAAIVVGMIVAPVAAIGAASVVHIAGSNGVPASVTNANQLTTAEAAPGSFREYAVSDTGCNLLFKVPVDKGFIIKTVVVNNVDTSGPIGVGTYTGLYLNDANCGGHYFLDVNPAQDVDHSTVPVEPGIAIRGGSRVFVGEFASTADVFVMGYLVPKNDVPVNTA